jgi:hypothetical protein
MFTLYEELLLLSIHEDKGIFIRSSMDGMKPGLAGAILAELALTGKIRTTNSRRLQLIDDSQTNDSILDETLTTLKEMDKERKFGYWLNALSQKPEKLRKQITASLIHNGVVTQEDGRLIWVIPSPMSTEIKASTKYWVINRLRSNVLAQEDIQLRDIALLGLVSASGLLDLVFLRDERKLARQYINELVVGQAMKEPVIEAIQEIVTAIAAEVEED